MIFSPAFAIVTYKILWYEQQQQYKSIKEKPHDQLHLIIYLGTKVSYEESNSVLASKQIYVKSELIKN